MQERVRRLVRVGWLAIACAAVLASFASVAAAAPSNYMGLDELQARLESGEDLNAYFHTEIGYSASTGESKVETYGVDILTITGGPDADSSLIMFNSDEVQTAFGGIVAGMSGSPVYVMDGATPKMVGAVSYGDMFTLGGTGLATPIEAMADLETRYARTSSALATVIPLDAPVLTDGGVVNRIIVSRSPEQYSAAAAAGALVAKPLDTLFIGGINPRSKAYRALSARLEGRGRSVAPLKSALGPMPGSGEASRDESFTAGSSVAALSARGDMWVGGVGTVTYTNGANVLAFGHPAYWEGPSALYMSNAVVDGIWPSSYWPYKVARPAAIRGQFTQDRTAGILGVDKGHAPVLDEAVITASASFTGTDGSQNDTEATSEVRIPRKYMKSEWDYYLGAFGLYPAGARIFDSGPEPGSAVTKTKVDLTIKSSGESTSVVVDNVYDTSGDISFDILSDAERVLGELASTNQWGGADYEVDAVSLEASITSDRSSYEIVGVKAEQGLKTGDNTITVEMLPYGSADATHTEYVKLNIPKGTPLSGTLSVSNGMSDGGYMIGEDYEVFFEFFEGFRTQRRTVTQIVKDLGDIGTNDEFTVSFMPMPYGSEEDPEAEVEGEPLKVTGKVDRFVSGYATAEVPFVFAEIYPTTVSYGGFALLTGGMPQVTEGEIKVYATRAGETSESLVATVPITAEFGEGYFETELYPLYQTTTYRIVFEGNEEFTGGQASAKVNVRPSFTLTTSASAVRRGAYVNLSAKLRPAATAGSKVVFEYNRNGRWYAFSGGTKTLTVSGAYAVASLRIKPAATVQVRCRFLGSVTNAASTSSVKKITVR